ncbi:MULTISPECIES: ABC transporter ATP-binding protein [Lactococcus]|uniref:ABC transporter ATP-binding protein n=1 Tax=Lactococcus TaxID=1357 RepID=UPI00203D0662|nr:MULTISPECIES: ABC transporter ATP-binding protein [Lactococcus]
MNKIIDIENLTVSFGNFEALKNVTCSIEAYPGIIGLIGPNGAGKTTLIHAILGQHKASQGKIRLANQALAYCPDTPEFPAHLTAKEVLQQSCALHEKPENAEQIETTLEKVGLVDYPSKKVGGYSRGMKQRLGIAVALLLDPVLIFLDEPTSALDPIGRIEILQLIMEVAQEKTVVVSSHLLADIENIADRLLVLNHGQLIFQGKLHQFIENSQMDDFAELEIKSEQVKQEVMDILQVNDIEFYPEITGKLMVKSEYTEKLLQVFPDIGGKISVYRATSNSLELAFERAIMGVKNEKINFS